jgi:hypothetical protein
MMPIRAPLQKLIRDPNRTSHQIWRVPMKIKYLLNSIYLTK